MTLAGIHVAWDGPTEYERWYASSLGRSYGLSVEQALRPWLALAAGKTLADIGCGPGLMIERLLPQSTRVVGIDCSFKMARRAAVRTQELDRSHRFVVGSIMKLPLPDACLDYAVCVNCMEFVDDRRAAFAEVARTLRTRGVAMIGVLNRQSVWRSRGVFAARLATNRTTKADSSRSANSVRISNRSACTWKTSKPWRISRRFPPVPSRTSTDEWTPLVC